MHSSVLRQQFAPAIRKDIWRQHLPQANCADNSRKPLVSAICAAGGEEASQNKALEAASIAMWTNNAKAWEKLLKNVNEKGNDVAKITAYSEEWAQKAEALAGIANGMAMQAIQTEAKAKAKGKDEIVKELGDLAESWMVTSLAWNKTSKAMRTAAELGGFQASTLESVEIALLEQADSFMKSKSEEIAAAWIDVSKGFSEEAKKVKAQEVAAGFPNGITAESIKEAKGSSSLSARNSPGVINIPVAALLGLVTGSTLTFAIFRRCSSASKTVAYS